MKPFHKIVEKINKDIWDCRLPAFLLFLYFLISSSIWGSICPMVITTGYPCPACGMTRAAFLFLKGQWIECFKMHPLFPFVLLLFFLGALNRYVLVKKIPHLKALTLFLMCASFPLYFWRFYTYFPDAEPMVYYDKAVFSDIIRQLWQ